MCARRNLNYWDSVSTLAGEVRDPGKTFPRALLLAVVLVVAMYLLPTMAALGIQAADSKGSDWGLGYYGLVAQQVRACVWNFGGRRTGEWCSRGVLATTNIGGRRAAGLRSRGVERRVWPKVPENAL